MADRSRLELNFLPRVRHHFDWYATVHMPIRVLNHMRTISTRRVAEHLELQHFNNEVELISHFNAIIDRFIVRERPTFVPIDVFIRNLGQPDELLVYARNNLMLMCVTTLEDFVVVQEPGRRRCNLCRRLLGESNSPESFVLHLVRGQCLLVCARQRVGMFNIDSLFPPTPPTS